MSLLATGILTLRLALGAVVRHPLTRSFGSVFTPLTV
jgi:hypothetical protein